MNSYQIKLDLVDASPKIMRKLLIPEKITFNQLHKMIQCVFGFGNYHMFEFFSDQAKLTKTSKIDEVLLNNKEIKYIYDFGDNWEISIILEKVHESEVIYPSCIEVIGPNPVEDSGGVDGFKDLLKILNNPYHPEYEMVKDYLESMDFKEIINISKLNEELKKCIRPKK